MVKIIRNSLQIKLTYEESCRFFPLSLTTLNLIAIGKCQITDV